MRVCCGLVFVCAPSLFSVVSCDRLDQRPGRVIFCFRAARACAFFACALRSRSAVLPTVTGVRDLVAVDGLLRFFLLGKAY